MELNVQVAPGETKVLTELLLKKSKDGWKEIPISNIPKQVFGILEFEEGVYSGQSSRFWNAFGCHLLSGRPLISVSLFPFCQS